MNYAIRPLGKQTAESKSFATGFDRCARVLYSSTPGLSSYPRPSQHHHFLKDRKIKFGTKAIINVKLRYLVLRDFLSSPIHPLSVDNFPSRDVHAVFYISSVTICVVSPT